MSDIKLTHLSPQEFVEFEVNSRESMRIKIAYLGQVPDTDKASIGVQVQYAGDIEVTCEGYGPRLPVPDVPLADKEEE